MENTIFDFIRSIAFLFLIGSLWNLQITWTCIKSRMSSSSGQIGLLPLELLVSAETLHIWRCPEYILISFNWNFMKLADNPDKYKISNEFDFQPDWTIAFGVTCPLMQKKTTNKQQQQQQQQKKHIPPCPENSLFSFGWIFTKIADNLVRQVRSLIRSLWSYFPLSAKKDSYSTLFEV